MPPRTPDLDALLAHSGWVRSLARSLVSDPSSADDVEQQAWVTALQHPPSHGGNLRSWWATVVRSVAGKGWREQGRRREVEEELRTLGGEANSVTPDDLAERLETFQRLAAAVVQLPEPYAVTIYLRYFEELTVREVAARTKVPVDTAQSRIGVGLSHLRSALQDELGSQWRHRCLIFATPLAPAPVLALGTAAGVAATLLSVAALAVWAPWEADHSELGQAQTKLTPVVAHLEGEEAEGSAANAVIRTEEAPIRKSHTGFRPAASVGPRVTVVDSHGNKPIPGAEVIVLDMGLVPLPEEQLMEAEGVGGLRFLRALGERYLADENGQIRIPRPKGKLHLIGISGEFVGILKTTDLTQRAFAGEDIVLRLDRVSTLPVKVMDLDGRPVEGAAVSLRLAKKSFHGGGIGAETNADGFAWIPLLGGILAVPERESFYVQLNALSQEPMMTKVDLWNLPKQAVTLIMPQTGQVEVSIRRASGALMKGDFMVTLTPLDEEGLAPLDGDGLVARTFQGRAFFPYVSLDQTLFVAAGSLDFSMMESTNSLGPTSANELVSIALQPKLSASFVMGKVLNTEGMVAKNLSLKARIRWQSADSDTTVLRTIQTNAEGKFRLQIEPECEAGFTRTFTVIMRKTKRKERRTATVDLSRTLSPGDHDLGAFVVETPPILVQGKILTFGGSPVAGAKVKVAYAKGKDISYLDTTAGSRGSIMVTESQEGAIDWQELDGLTATTGEQGQFTIYAHADRKLYRVEARHRDHRKGWAEFAPPITTVELRFGETWTVKGHLFLDPSIPTHGVHVALLTPKPNAPGEFYGNALFADAKGDFEFRGIIPGTYGLRVQSAWLDEELFFISPQKLLPTHGEFVFPDIDLRGQLHVIRATVVDESGQLVKDGRLWNPILEYRDPFDFQPLPLVSKSPRFDLEFSAENKRGVALHQVQGDQRVVLKNGIPCTLVLDNPDIVPADWDLHATMFRVSADGSLHPNRSIRLKLDASGKDEIRLAWPGNYRIELQVYHARNNSSIHRWVPFSGTEDTKVFTVLDHDDGQEFHFSMDPQKLAQAMQEQ
ncbi:MAG: sigma-70 family RNA polymerase sigma factor [Planctomycetota bacterium]